MKFSKKQIEYYGSVGKDRYAIKMRVMVKKLEKFLDDKHANISDTDLELIQGFDSYLRENRNIKIEVYLLDGRKVSAILTSQTTHLEVAKNQMHFVSILDLSTGSHIGKLSFIKTN